MTRTLSRLARIVLAAPLAIASLAYTAGCTTIDYHGKRVHWYDIKRHLQKESDGEAGKNIANFVDRDGNDDIDPDDIDRLKPALIAGGITAYVVDWGIRKCEEFREGIRNRTIPLLNSQNFGDKNNE